MTASINYKQHGNVLQWKGINCKQSTRWQHLFRLKASAFFSLQKNFSCYETQQLILGTRSAIWWVTEPHYADCRILFITMLNVIMLTVVMLSVVVPIKDKGTY